MENNCTIQTDFICCPQAELCRGNVGKEVQLFSQGDSDEIENEIIGSEVDPVKALKCEKRRTSCFRQSTAQIRVGTMIIFSLICFPTCSSFGISTSSQLMNTNNAHIFPRKSIDISITSSIHLPSRRIPSLSRFMAENDENLNGKATSKKSSKAKAKDKTWNNTSLFPAKGFTTELEAMEEFEIKKEIYTQSIAALIGALTGLAVAGFKLSIDEIRQFCYGGNLNVVFPDGIIYTPFYAVPFLGAVLVSMLSLTGDFSPGLKGVVKEVDEDSLSYGAKMALKKSNQSDNNIVLNLDSSTRSFRKALAAIVTLGTGNSLGPEGPGVEIGAAISRLCSNIWSDNLSHPSSNENGGMLIDSKSENTSSLVGERLEDRIARNRLLLACGAAAGVSSGFNAPLSGVFFALEVVQSSLPALSVPSPPPETGGISSSKDRIELQQQSLTTTTGSIAAILISSVLAALVARVILGDELALQLMTYNIQTPLSELPLFLSLGVSCGFVAVVFTQTAQLSRAIFKGSAGPQFVRDVFGNLPAYTSPIIGGMIGGGVGYFYPQVLFFGYETLNGLLNNGNLPTQVLFSLLVAKTFTTAVSAGSGLVGGTLAPSLFLGGMTGAIFYNMVITAFGTLAIDTTIVMSDEVFFRLADLPIYSSVGAASVLAAIFRAPLTASLLMFEITRNYDVLLPLLVSAGIATLSSDIIESKINAKK